MTNFNEIRKRAEAIRQIPVDAMRKQDIAQLRVDNRRLIAEVIRLEIENDVATDEPQKNTAEAVQTK